MATADITFTLTWQGGVPERETDRAVSLSAVLPVGDDLSRGGTVGICIWSKLRERERERERSCKFCSLFS